MNNTNTLYDTKYPNSVMGAGTPINTVAKTIDIADQTTTSGLCAQMTPFCGKMSYPYYKFPVVSTKQFIP